LEISKRYNLSWKLEKCLFFAERLEFVGMNIAKDGNRPPKSKTPLFEMWQTKKPQTTQKFASYIGLVGYYCNWIPYFEFRIRTIRQLMPDHDYSHKLTEEELSPAVYDEMYDLGVGGVGNADVGLRYGSIVPNGFGIRKLMLRCIIYSGFLNDLCNAIIQQEGVLLLGGMMMTMITKRRIASISFSPLM